MTVNLETVGEGVQNVPDADSMKLFVGQISRTMTEEELREMFEEFGPVHTVVMLKDPKTQQNKGCAFLHFYKRQSAIDAQVALHGKRTIDGMQHPMQVKPANSEIKSEEERRLFVGMLSRTTTQEQLATMFLPFGAIEDSVIIVDSDGKSKGCAFVTYTTQRSALNAIKALNHSQTFDGCRAPLVVKFADTQQQKDMKRKQVSSSTAGANNPMQNMPFMGQTFGNTARPPVSNPGFPYPSMSNFNTPPFGSGFPTPIPTQFPPSPAQAFNPQNLQAMQALAQLATNPALSALLNPAIVQQFASAAAVLGATAPLNTQGSYTGAYGSMPQTNYNFGSTNGSKRNTGSTSFGAEGCSLFVYHVPVTYSDSDLAQLFTPFGNVVSAKVFIDKVTNMSKGYGFVNFDNKVAASNAIKAMNGFMIGSQKLKVQLKTAKGSKPY